MLLPLTKTETAWVGGLDPTGEAIGVVLGGYQERRLVVHAQMALPALGSNPYLPIASRSIKYAGRPRSLIFFWVAGISYAARWWVIVSASESWIA